MTSTEPTLLSAGRIAGFLFARLAEREGSALTVQQQPDASPDALAAAAWTLADCESKRLLLRLFRPEPGDLRYWKSPPLGLKILALPDRWHPEFDPNWEI